MLESQDYQFVCAEVQSGDVAGRDIEIYYVVEDHSMRLLHSFSVYYIIIYTAADAQTQNGTLLFTDDATIQCVAVSVSSVSAGSTDESCLSLTLSSATTVSGLTITPYAATICVASPDGML